MNEELFRFYTFWANNHPAVFEMEKVILTTRSEWWENITKHGTHFWEYMPLYSQAKDLISFVEKISKNYAVLTSPSRHPESIVGKVNFYRNNFGQAWVRNHLLIGAPKYVCAHWNSLLVDDRDAGISEFEYHGGHGIVYPRPWNSRCLFAQNVGFCEKTIFAQIKQDIFDHAYLYANDPTTEYLESCFPDLCQKV